MIKLMQPLEEHPPEEISIKNTQSIIPNIETTSKTVTRRPEKKQRKSRVIIKSPQEVAMIKAQASNLTKLNKHKLTLCPKCEKLGYAKYFSRYYGLLCLRYSHSNEPPVKTRMIKSLKNKSPTAVWRTCYIGEVISEAEFLSKYVRRKPQENVLKIEDVARTPPPPKTVTSLLRRSRHYRVKAETDLRLRLLAKYGSSVTNVRLKIPAGLAKKLDSERGKITRTGFLLTLLEEALMK